MGLNDKKRKRLENKVKKTENLRQLLQYRMVDSAKMKRIKKRKYKFQYEAAENTKKHETAILPADNDVNKLLKAKNKKNKKKKKSKPSTTIVIDDEKGATNTQTPVKTKMSGSSKKKDNKEDKETSDKESSDDSGVDTQNTPETESRKKKNDKNCDHDESVEPPAKRAKDGRPSWKNEHVLPATKEDNLAKEVDRVLLSKLRKERKEIKKMERATNRKKTRPGIFLTLHNLLIDDPIYSSLPDDQRAMYQDPTRVTDMENAGAELAANDIGEPEVLYSPLFVMDIQHLLLTATYGVDCARFPRWCKLKNWDHISRVMLVIVKGMGQAEFSNPDNFCRLKPLFEGVDNCVNVRIRPPKMYGVSVLSELLTLPMSVRQIRKNALDSLDLSTRYGKGKRFRAIKDGIRDESNALLKEKRPLFVKSERTIVTQVRTKDEGKVQTKTEVSKTKEQPRATVADAQEIEPIPRPIGSDEFVPGAKDRFNRVELLLSPKQMLFEGFPMPIGDNKMTEGFKYTKQRYAKVLQTSPMFAMDCEMCMTTIRKLEVTRVSLVNEKLECVYDALVKPYHHIIDYLTKYSGITKEMMDTCTTRLPDAQKRIQEILPPDAILIGQSLCGDLKVMKMFHPYVIDTSVIYNLNNSRHMKTGLRKLMDRFLQKSIQEGSDGHSPIEDSASALELVLHKLSKYPEYGDMIMGWDPTMDNLPLCDYCLRPCGHSCDGSPYNFNRHLGDPTVELKSKFGVISESGDNKRQPEILTTIDESGRCALCDRRPKKPATSQEGGENKDNMRDEEGEEEEGYCECGPEGCTDDFREELLRRSVFFSTMGKLGHTRRLVEFMRDHNKSVHYVGMDSQFVIENRTAWEDLEHIRHQVELNLTNRTKYFGQNRTAASGWVPRSTAIAQREAAQRKDFQRKYKLEPKTQGTLCTYTPTRDNEVATEKAVVAMKEDFMTIVNLEASCEQDRKAVLSSVDKQLERLVRACPEKALVCVYLSGSEKEFTFNDIDDGILLVKTQEIDEEEERMDVEDKGMGEGGDIQGGDMHGEQGKRSSESSSDSSGDD